MPDGFWRTRGGAAPDWFWNAREPWSQRALRAPLQLAECPYRGAARLHRAAYERGWVRRVRLPCRVVSVGNLTVGGSGKTPLVGWLAAELRARGRKLAILSRGVGGASGQRTNVVSDGERMLLSPVEVGDEPVLLAGQLPGVPVLAGHNRVALGLRAAALFGVEVCLLDDGFQHHRVERDVNLVCIDGRSGLGNGHVLPRGPLREPVGALSRADAIIWTRPGAVAAPGAERVPTDVPHFRMQIGPAALRRLPSGEREGVEALSGARVGLLAAIARPDRFAEDLRRLGAEVVDERIFPDHHAYTREDLAALDAELPWVTTAKDAVKIPAEWLGAAAIRVLEERVTQVDGARLVDWLSERLDAAGRST